MAEKNKIVFATNNMHKLQEVQNIIGNKVEVLSLSDVGFSGEIPEDYETIEENAIQKAQYIYEKTGYACFADDTSLEVDALDGKPGVYSARYAGENVSAKANIEKLLSEMQGVENREAQFRTVIAFVDGKSEFTFEGNVKGKITNSLSGNNGFGYDPIFMPSTYDKTFAELSAEIKNKISHRANATKKFVEFICKINP